MNRELRSENPYHPPAVEIVALSKEEEPRDLATRGERFSGHVIDGVVSIVVFAAFAVMMEISGMGSRYPSGTRLFPTTNNLPLTIGGLVIYLGIQAPFLHRSGQTLGKRAAGTAIVDLAGNKPPLSSLLVRRYGMMYLISLIPIAGPFLALGDALLIFTRHKRCLHDYIAGTKVVSVSRKAEPERGKKAPDGLSRDREKEAKLFDEFAQQRLALKAGSFDPNADFITELRIPKAELLAFYTELEERIFIRDINALERCRTYAEAKIALDLS